MSAHGDFLDPDGWGNPSSIKPKRKRETGMSALADRQIAGEELTLEELAALAAERRAHLQAALAAALAVGA